MSGDTQRAILAELAAGMQEITRLVGLDRESGEVGPTVERVAALAGSNAAPTALRRWRDRQGDVWQETVLAPALQLVVYAEGEPAFGGVFQAFQHVEDKWGPLVPVASEDVASPAAPADDETVKRIERAIHDALCGCDLPGADSCEHWAADLTRASRAALAALREGKQQ